MEKTKIFMPHVEKTAVVTSAEYGLVNKPKVKDESLQWPGIALSRTMSAILNPPSRTTCARQAYKIFVRSNFSPLPVQQYLNALSEDES